MKIRVQQVSKSFGEGAAEFEALRQVSIEIEEGKFVSLLGPSGCGKTTLLRVMNGLIRPDAGTVEIDGSRVEGPSNSVGFVFQQDALWPWRDVVHNITFGLEIRKVPWSEASQRAQELIRLVGLTGFERHFPHQLSGGMRQRVNLARALAINPEVLLMDEPFAALDAQTREVMQLELLRIWSASKKTVAFVTHQIDEAVFLSDEVIVMGARPGHIREVVPIPFERPRQLTVKRSVEFNAIVEHIWGRIEDQIKGLVGGNLA